MKIQTVKKSSVSDQVFKQIRSMIVNGEWKIGERIPSEAQLTEMFGVSRISVREAIKQLVGLGILEARQGSGTYVCSNSDRVHNPSMANLTIQHKNDLMNLLEVRRAIEVEAAGLAAKRATPEQVDHLREICDKSLQEGLTHEQHTELDLEFHRSIFISSNNRYICQVLDMISKPLKDFYNTALICNLNECNGPARHEQIMNAIKNHNETEARLITQFHLDDTINAVFHSDETALFKE